MCISYSLIQTKEVLPTLNIKQYDFIELWDFELLSQASNSVVLENRREGMDLFLPLETVLCAPCLNSSVFVQGTGKGGFCLVQHHKHIKYESSPDSGNAWGCHAEKCHCVLCLEILHEINVLRAFPVLLLRVCELQLLQSLLTWF